MKIKSKLILFYGFVFSFFIAIFYLISQNVFLKGFEKIEDDHFKNNIERFKEIIVNEQSALSVTSIGWSTWNDTYKYVEHPNNKYINENYLNDSYFDNKISSVLIFKGTSQHLFSSEYDFANKKIVKISDSEIKFISSLISTITKDNSASEPLNGVYFYNNQAKLYSINYILPSTDTIKYKSNGFMVFTRNIDKEMISNFERTLRFKVIPNYKAIFDSKIKDLSVKTETETEAEVFIPINDKKNSVEYELIFKREIYTYGKTIVFYLSLALVGISLLITLVNYSYINFLITNKILKLTKELESISNGSSDKQHVTNFELDEIGLLSNKINYTLDKIKENQNIINHSAKFASLGEMAGSIAHEINNPLSVIQGYSQKIVKCSNDNKLNHEELVKNSEKILQNVDRIVRIIKSLKLVSRSGENDEMKVIKTGEILIELENLYNYNLRNKDIQIELQHFDKNLEINVNYVQILQVFINIINNAIDAITPLENRWIRIETKVNNQNIEFHITDCGKKIPDHIAAKILEPFFTTKSIGKGTGLGLSIANKIVKNHNGSLYLNKDSENTCFVISLPLAESNIQQKAS